jgi:hypothetical protein
MASHHLGKTENDESMESSSFILAGWLIDGTGGPIRSNILIHIEGGVIVSLKKARNDELTAINVQVLDLSHCTILPALVDCHVHLTMSGTVDEEYRKRQLSINFEQAKSAIADHLRDHLDHGVLAVRDGGDSAAYTLRYKKDRALHDKYPVYVKAAGKAWHSRGRYGRLIGVPPADGCTLAHCISGQKEKPDHIKIINSGLNSLTNFGKEMRQSKRAAGLSLIPWSMQTAGSLFGWPLRQDVDPSNMDSLWGGRILREWRSFKCSGFLPLSA